MALQGIDVQIVTRSRTGEDEFGSPIYEETEETVHNVLVAPLSSQELLETVNLYGKKAVYQIAIPKGDTHVWEDAVVKFFGKRWHVFTLSQKGIDDLIPLGWNDKYQVELYE